MFVCTLLIASWEIFSLLPWLYIDKVNCACGGGGGFWGSGFGGMGGGFGQPQVIMLPPAAPASGAFPAISAPVSVSHHAPPSFDNPGSPNYADYYDPGTQYPEPVGEPVRVIINIHNNNGNGSNSSMLSDSVASGRKAAAQKSVKDGQRKVLGSKSWRQSSASKPAPPPQRSPVPSKPPPPFAVPSPLQFYVNSAKSSSSSRKNTRGRITPPKPMMNNNRRRPTMIDNTRQPTGIRQRQQPSLPATRVNSGGIGRKRVVNVHIERRTGQGLYQNHSSNNDAILLAENQQIPEGPYTRNDTSNEATPPVAAAYEEGGLINQYGESEEKEEIGAPPAERIVNSGEQDLEHLEQLLHQKILPERDMEDEGVSKSKEEEPEAEDVQPINTSKTNPANAGS